MPANLWDLSGGRLALHFHAGQSRAWKSRRRFIAILAGTQGGKTSFGPWWLWREIQQRGAGDYIAATATYDLFKLKMLPALRETFEDVLRIGRYWAGDRILELCDPATKQFKARRATDPMWGRIILRSAESGSGLESATAKGAWLDEAGQDSFTLETWEAVQRRLSLNLGRALLSTTIYNLGWIKAELYDPWKAGDKSIDVVQFRSTINPSFPRAEFERMRGKMQAARFAMFYLGLFSKPAGLIYNDFDPATQRIAPFEIPSYWPRVVGVDFGAVNTATVWIAEKPGTGDLFLYRETLEGDKTTHEHAEQARATAAGATVAHWVGGAPSETQQRMDWTFEGIPVMAPTVADVESGIDRVAGLFKSRRLYIFNTCRGTLDELGGYRRIVDDRGETTDKIENKRMYHRLDALRYAATVIGLERGTIARSYVR